MPMGTTFAERRRKELWHKRNSGPLKDAKVGDWVCRRFGDGRTSCLQITRRTPKMIECGSKWNRYYLNGASVGRIGSVSLATAEDIAEWRNAIAERNANAERRDKEVAEERAREIARHRLSDAGPAMLDALKASAVLLAEGCAADHPDRPKVLRDVLAAIAAAEGTAI